MKRLLRLIAAIGLLAVPCFAEQPGTKKSVGPDDRDAAVLKAPVVGLWLMGQSLCEGAEALPLVTPSDSGWGNFAFKRGVRTWIAGDLDAEPEKREEGQFEFVPLAAAVFGGLGETMANGLADHLKASLMMGDHARAKNAAPHFLVAYAGQGGRMIEELSIADESRDPRTPKYKFGKGGFYKTSLDDARRAKKQARALGKEFAIAATVWMQGEANGGLQGGIAPSRWQPELPYPVGQQWYRDRLIAYRKQWSDDLRAITGQSGEIPMFTYQTLAAAGEAQLMAADRDPQIYMVGPHYMVPSAVNSRRAGKHGAAIHLAADGERWYGEQVAKVVRRVLADGEDWQPLRPRRAWIDNARTSVLVEFAVPRPPLVIDERFFPREQSETEGGFGSLCGFQLRGAAGTRPTLKTVEVESPTRVRLQLASALPSGMQYTLSYGQSYAGKLGVIAGIRNGPESEGRPTTELVIDGDLPAWVKSLTAEGAFNAQTVSGNNYAQMVIRSVQRVHGSSVLRFENAERRGDLPLAVGQTLTALRMFAYGNLRDSDPEEAIYPFADKSYGTRAGQRYPLWNWCVLFSGFPIGEMEDPS
ncbi:MAG TPA: hypothetical protein VHV55_28350 [Pirellulales bacterium]|jgi:hypothetical protein|nr:hypothetical protein [Pirellulales bacterium]